MSSSERREPYADSIENSSYSRISLAKMLPRLFPIVDVYPGIVDDIGELLQGISPFCNQIGGSQDTMIFIRGSAADRVHHGYPDEFFVPTDVMKSAFRRGTDDPFAHDVGMKIVGVGDLDITFDASYGGDDREYPHDRDIIDTLADTVNKISANSRKPYYLTLTEIPMNSLNGESDRRIYASIAWCREGEDTPFFILEIGQIAEGQETRVDMRNSGFTLTWESEALLQLQNINGKWCVRYKNLEDKHEPGIPYLNKKTPIHITSATRYIRRNALFNRSGRGFTDGLRGWVVPGVPSPCMTYEARQEMPKEFEPFGVRDVFPTDLALLDLQFPLAQQALLPRRLELSSNLTVAYIVDPWGTLVQMDVLGLLNHCPLGKILSGDNMNIVIQKALELDSFGKIDWGSYPRSLIAWHRGSYLDLLRKTYYESVIQPHLQILNRGKQCFPGQINEQSYGPWYFIDLFKKAQLINQDTPNTLETFLRLIEMVDKNYQRSF